MPRRKAQQEPEDDYELPQMQSEEAIENLLINESVKLVYKRLKNGTASAQEVCHFLKLGSTKSRLENQILEGQKDLISAKTKAIVDGEDFKRVAEEAMAAMSEYKGTGGGDAD